MKLIFTVLIFFITSSTAFAEDVFNGYNWQELPLKSKRAYIMGFMSGYEAGVITAVPATILNSQNIFESTLESKDEELKKIIGCKDFITNNINSFTTLTPIFISITNDKHDADYYINETDHFLKTYPLCKRININTLLMQLSFVWFNIYDDETTYKQLGDDCANKE
jgi:hypothetical protein